MDGLRQNGWLDSTMTANRDDLLLEIRDLTISYRFPDGGVVTVLYLVSVSVSNGESIAVVGDSGCGKSTLALAVMRMLPANAMVSGTIRYRGKDLLALPEDVMEKLRGD